MAETLGSLCDKLTIVKLKQFHSTDAEKLASLANQEKQLQEEIDTFVSDALSGRIPFEKLSFAANKVYKKEGNEIEVISGNIGQIFAKLAEVNCKLWHEQDKVYDFSKVPAEEKDIVVKQLGVLNLERNQYIDKIDSLLKESLKK
ncbi:MAG: hypothetical protein IKD08_06075 [Alphaproteobacteria bacterium]|nr:hypothetical protein [Alphaproteobacteria bacterium]